MNYVVRGIAILEIAAGLSGLISGIFQIANSPVNLGVKVMFGSFVLSLFLLSVLAGGLLWRLQKIGVVLSIIVQALQIPEFAIGRVLYRFVSGAEFAIRLAWPNVSTGWHIGSDFLLDINRQDYPLMFGVNLVSLAMVLLLVQYWRQRTVSPATSVAEMAAFSAAGAERHEWSPEQTLTEPVRASLVLGKIQPRWYRNIKWWKLIAWFEVLSGTIGLTFIFYVGVSSFAQFGFLYVAELFAFLALNMAAGLFLLEGQRRGKVLSIIAQALQVPHLSVGSFVFHAFAGPHMMLLSSDVDQALHFKVGASVAFMASATLGNGQFSVGLNFVSLLLLFYLFWLRTPIQIADRQPDDPFEPTRA